MDWTKTGWTKMNWTKSRSTIPTTTLVNDYITITEIISWLAARVLRRRRVWYAVKMTIIAWYFVCCIVLILLTWFFSVADCSHYIKVFLFSRHRWLFCNILNVMEHGLIHGTIYSIIPALISRNLEKYWYWYLWYWYELLNAITLASNNVFHIRFLRFDQQKIRNLWVLVSMILIGVIKWHHFYMEQYIPYSLVCNLFSRNSITSNWSPWCNIYLFVTSNYVHHVTSIYL